MNNYSALKEQIDDWIQREKENLEEATKVAGINCVGAGMAMGAIDAYEEVLSAILELEGK